MKSEALPDTGNAVTVKTKRCPRCKETKPLTPEYWHRHRKKQSGYHGHCKECKHAQDNARRDAQRPDRKRLFARPVRWISEGGVLVKRCPICGEAKPLKPEYWPHAVHTYDGYYGFCRACNGRRIAASQDRTNPDRKKLLRKHLSPKGIMVKQCYRCGEIKPTTEEYWYLNKKRPFAYCKSCFKKNTNENSASAVRSLASRYLKALLRDTGFNSADITPDMIELKKQQIIMHRSLKKLSRRISDESDSQDVSGK